MENIQNGGFGESIQPSRVNCLCSSETEKLVELLDNSGDYFVKLQ